MRYVAAVVRWLRAGLIFAVLFTPGWGGPPATLAAGPTPPEPTVGEATTAVYNSSHLQACASNLDSTQTTTSGSFQSLVSCNLTVGRSGRVLVLASGSVGLVSSTDSFEAEFRVDHNTGLTGDVRTGRTVDAFPDTGQISSGADGTDRNVSISAYYTVTAGVHTFALLYRRTEGDDAVEVIDPAINVLFVPDGLDVQMCGQMFQALWTASSSTPNPTVKCSLTAPRPGLVFVSADAWAGLDSPASGPVEAGNGLSQNGAASIGLRYTNVYTNGGDGADTTIASTAVFTVSAGLHEFSLRFWRQSGSNPARLANAGLVALFVPFDSGYARACGANGADLWQNSTGSDTALASCSLNVGSSSWAFVSGTAGVGQTATEAGYEAKFGLALDGTSPQAAGSRYINSYADSGNGLDASTADALIVPVSAGSHTFRLVGRRFAGSGTVEARYPVLFVLTPGTETFLPLVVR